MKFGERLREQRKACGLTMEELGKKIGVTGAAISRYELGQREPSFRGIELLAEALNVSPAFLQGYELPHDAASQYPPFPEDRADVFLNGSTADNLRALREAKGMSQKELAERAGIEIKYIRNFEDENSMFFPTEDDLRKLSDVFRVAPKYILGKGISGKQALRKHIENLKSQIQSDMDKLSIMGMEEAVKRVEELTELPRYQAKK